MAYNNRSYVYTNQGQYNQATADYTRAIELASLPDQTSLGYMNRGFAYRRLGRNDEAITDYTRAIEFDPRNAIAYFNRGHAYASKRLYDQARREFQASCSMGDQDACKALRIPIEKLRSGGTKYEDTHHR